MRNDTVTVEKTYNASIAAVCAALTDPEQMKQWYFDVPEFKPEVGCEFSFLAGKADQKWLHLCRVTDVVKGTLITYSWRYDGYPGESFVTFRLHEAHSGTHLTITHVGLASFPDMENFRSDNFNTGWTYFATDALPKFLEKNQ